VQPDVIVVCDKSKLSNIKYCNGAPDMVVEVLSPSNSENDLTLKYQKYEFAGVREYWIIDPETSTVKACVLKNGKYTITEYGGDDVAPIAVLEGCKINMKEVFADELIT
jgi:Uma2 family endonuclease